MWFPKASRDSHRLAETIHQPSYSIFSFWPFPFSPLSPFSACSQTVPPLLSCLSGFWKRTSPKALGSLPLMEGQGCSWPYICRKSASRWLIGPTRSQARRAHLSPALLWPSWPGHRSLWAAQCTPAGSSQLAPTEVWPAGAPRWMPSRVAWETKERKNKKRKKRATLKSWKIDTLS